MTDRGKASAMMRLHAETMPEGATVRSGLRQEATMTLEAYGADAQAREWVKRGVRVPATVVRLCADRFVIA